MTSYTTGTKWGSPVVGTPGGQVTWSFSSVPGLFTAFTNFADAAGFQPAIRAAFDVWESIANIDFVEIGNAASAMVRVGWGAIDGAGNTLGHAQWRYSGGQTQTGEVIFDTAESWNIGASAKANGINFLAVAVHEIGHILGLSHSSDPSSLMYPYLNSQRMPSADDRAEAQAVYGAAPAAQVAAPATAGPNDVFRFYDTNTGVHFYTASTAERDGIVNTLPNYKLEGNAFDVPTTGTAIDVFRFYNSDTGTHFYTASAAERDQVIATHSSYNYEGVAYRASSDSANGTLDALHRFYNVNTGTHFYTASEAERITILGTLPQYHYEGVAYYVDAA